MRDAYVTLTLERASGPGRRLIPYILGALLAVAALPMLAGSAFSQDARSQDRNLIRAASQSFVKAFEAGDAKALAAHWTEEGEFIADDGEAVRGRENIERVYGELFKKAGGLKAHVDVESIRFTSKNTAIEEGYMRVTKAKTNETSASRYSVLHVREDGKWQMAVVREWPIEGLTLLELDWLIGTWASKRDGLEVRTSYDWYLNKNFIRSIFSIQGKDKSLAGEQIIARDVSTQSVRSWTFEGEGGFGHAVWTREGNKWIQKADAVLANGSILSATNIIIRLDNDSFTFQSVDRSIDELPIPDIAPIRVNRVKTTK